MLHAYRHPIRVFDLDYLDMLVGADTAGRMLEIGVTAAECVEFIVHATTCNCTMTGADHNNIPSGGGDSGSPLFRSGSAIGVHATSGGKFTLVSDAMWLWGIDVVT